LVVVYPPPTSPGLQPGPKLKVKLELQSYNYRFFLNKGVDIAYSTLQKAAISLQNRDYSPSTTQPPHSKLSLQPENDFTSTMSQNPRSKAHEAFTSSENPENTDNKLLPTAILHQN
jgi:hypothetical protein